MSKFLRLLILPMIICHSYTYNIYVGSTGLLFPYSLGALSYIKSEIKPDKCHFHGVSGGAWCSIIYDIENDLQDHDKLWNTYIGNNNTTFKIYDMKTMENIHKNMAKNVLKRYKQKKKTNIPPLSIYVTQVEHMIPKNIVINDFKNIEDILMYASYSSYIPFICGKGLWMQDGNCKYLDGAFFHKKPNINFDYEIDVLDIMKTDRSKINKRFILDIHKSRHMFKKGWEYSKNNFKLRNIH